MRVAICSHDTEERYLISRLTDAIILPKGKIPKISLFPLPHELLETTASQTDKFDLVLLSGHTDERLLQQLCSLAPVILIGKPELGLTAFEVGAAYFIEAPADPEKLDKAIDHFMKRNTPPRRRYC